MWPKPIAVSIMAMFPIIALAFFGANALKVLRGRWVTLAVALAIFIPMTTWKTGRRLVAERLTAGAVSLDDTTYFLGPETIIVARSQGMAVWREKLFVLMARNAVRATACSACRQSAWWSWAFR